MVYCSTASRAAHHIDMVLFHKSAVDLRLRVLILTDDDSVVILPQQQVLSFPAVAQDIFFEGAEYLE